MHLQGPRLCLCLLLHVSSSTISGPVSYICFCILQGVLFTVYVHAARALTEQKEKTAEIIHD